MVDLQEILEMKLEEDITPVQLSVDMAVPLALFMTEAVTNAVKHNKRPETPRIKVSFGPVGDDRWCLSVADSGQGFPAEFKSQVPRRDREVVRDEIDEGVRYPTRR
jgi:two-component sensor histidine kinase